ncbi:MAG: CFI-box-CTERM domain-containing protein [Verrucomicrobiota bacterium]
MNRRRFLTLLALAGVPVSLRSQDKESSPSEAADSYYEAETRLYPGKIPHITGTLKSSGRMKTSGADRGLRRNSKGDFELAPVDLREARPTIGSFATFEQQSANVAYLYPRFTFSVLDSPQFDPKPEGWGPKGEKNLLRPFNLNFALSPYHPGDYKPTLPYKFELKARGKRLMSREATTRPISTKNALNGYTYLSVQFHWNDDRELSYQIFNAAEKANQFELTLRDSSNKKLATLNFDASGLTDLRNWITNTLLFEHNEAIAYGKGKRVEKQTVSSSAGSYAPISCYLTTATVHTIGLADDCWELQTLRKFRDTRLAATESGKATIAEYYQIAPEIVSKINRRPDAERVWLKTYWATILPSALLLKLRLHKLATLLYKRTTRKLQIL